MGESQSTEWPQGSLNSEPLSKNANSAWLIWEHRPSTDSLGHIITLFINNVDTLISLNFWRPFFLFVSLFLSAFSALSLPAAITTANCGAVQAVDTFLRICLLALSEPSVWLVEMINEESKWSTGREDIQKCPLFPLSTENKNWTKRQRSKNRALKDSPLLSVTALSLSLSLTVTRWLVLIDGCLSTLPKTNARHQPGSEH